MTEFDHEACKAMESVMSKIGDYFGVRPGDVDGLFAAIEQQFAELNESERQTRAQLNRVIQRDRKIEFLIAENKVMREAKD